jgi:hypothetical protein
MNQKLAMSLQISKKAYIKPEITRIELDSQISLCMMSWQPGDGKPPYPPGKPPHPHQTFENPFADNPFK